MAKIAAVIRRSAVLVGWSLPFLATTGSNATAQVIMKPVYTMTCFPENPVRGPDGSAQQYAPYKMAWDGQNRVIVTSAAAGPELGAAYQVKRTSPKSALMQSRTGSHSYALKLDFERGSVTYDYGRIDECTVTKNE